MRPFHLLHITDCHLSSQPDHEFLGLNTDESLSDVLNLMQKQERPDLILCSGDISNDGGVASYERFVSFVREIFPETPLAWLPGNHDDPINMDQVKDLPIEAHHSVADWNFIFLDSTIPMEEGGEIKLNELQRMETELQKYPDKPTMIFLHHQPVAVGSKWVDQYTVKNNDEFFEVVDRYNNVKAISWGHVHQEFTANRDGVALLASPSTCVQFVPNSDDFQVDRIMPGYRHYKLFPDGNFTTDVRRVVDKQYGINFDATGY